MVRGKKEQNRDVVEGNIVNEIAPDEVSHHCLSCNARLSDDLKELEQKIVSEAISGARPAAPAGYSSTFSVSGRVAISRDSLWIRIFVKISG